MLGTVNELASAVAGGLPFLIQPPIPTIALDEGDLQHMVGLYRFGASLDPSATSRVAAAVMYYPTTKELVLRCWLEDAEGVLQGALLLGTSTAEVHGDDGEILAHAEATADPVGGSFLELSFQVALALSHTYRVHARIEWLGGSFERDFIFSVTR